MSRFFDSMCYPLSTSNLFFHPYSLLRLNYSVNVKADWLLITDRQIELKYPRCCNCWIWHERLEIKYSVCIMYIYISSMASQMCDYSTWGYWIRFMCICILNNGVSITVCGVSLTENKGPNYTKEDFSTLFSTKG